MQIKIILDIPKGKPLRNCYLNKIEVLNKKGDIAKTITEGIKPLKLNVK